MKKVIPFQGLMQKIRDIFGLLAKKPVSASTVWEDKNSCITVAKSPKFTPRANHIAMKYQYHHFRSVVSEGRVVINPIDTSEQLADMLTKPLSPNFFAT